MFTLCKSWMMEKSYNYKYPSVLECAQAVTMPCAKYFDKQTHSCAECNYVIFVLKKSEVKRLWGTTNLMAHGSWLLRSGSRVCLVLQGFHYCAMYYRQSQPNFEWNKTRSKDTLPYLTKILTITSIVACQLSYNVEYICWRNFTQKNNNCIRIHTQAHTHSEPTDLSWRNCFYVHC